MIIWDAVDDMVDGARKVGFHSLSHETIGCCKRGTTIDQFYVDIMISGIS